MNGSIDILVDNAGNAGPEGFTDMRPFAETDPVRVGALVRVNLYGVMNCTRAALPGMIERNGGRIVTIVSDAARYGDASSPRTPRPRRERPASAVRSPGGRSLRHHGQLHLSRHHPDADHDASRHRLAGEREARSSSSRSTSSGARASRETSPVWWHSSPAPRPHGSPARPTRSMAAIPCRCKASNCGHTHLDEGLGAGSLRRRTLHKAVPETPTHATLHDSTWSSVLHREDRPSPTVTCRGASHQ